MTERVEKAVALRYPEWADAPYIAAKAKGVLAERLVKVASENGVPVVQNPEMADVLSIHRFGESIPEETYAAIAAIFAFVIKLDRGETE